MNDTLLVIIFTIIGFFAVILSLAVSTSTNNKIVMICSCITVVVGILAYSYCYSYEHGLSVITVTRSLLMVCRMFSGGSDYPAFSVTPLAKSKLIVALFWIGHFVAFYMTASTAVKVIGKQLMKSLRTRLLRKKEAYLAYDPTPDTISLIGEGTKNRAIILVSEQNEESVNALAEVLGGVSYAGGRAACSNSKFLKTIGMHKSSRILNVYCIGKDPTMNLRYAEALLAPLQELKVPPESTSLFLLDVPEDRASRLLSMNGRYGYGSVLARRQYDLVAYLAMDYRAPWTFLHFEPDARTKDDFCVFIIGFGQMGQTLLRHLIINSQVEGCTFHAEVFDRLMDEEIGFFDACYPQLLKTYDIALHTASANSDHFYNRLNRNPPNLIALCSGDQKHNMELGQILYRRYGSRSNRPCLMQCTYDTVMIDEVEYLPKEMYVNKIDRLAMILNHVYQRGPSAEEDWKTCDPFSRASYRAFVGFISALLYAAGLSREDVLEGKWPPSPEILENLYRTEHRRWCAFLLALGYTPMDERELNARCEAFQRGEITDIIHNTASATHACLIPWDQLDALSSRISEITGKTVDFKSRAQNNVLAISDVLRQSDKTDKKRYQRT